MSSQAFLAYWTIVDTVGFPYTTPSFYHFRDYQPTDSTSISFPEDFFPTRDHFAAHLADQLQGLGLNSPDPSSPQSIIKVNRSVARVPCLPEWDHLEAYVWLWRPECAIWMKFWVPVQSGLITCSVSPLLLYFIPHLPHQCSFHFSNKSYAFTSFLGLCFWENPKKDSKSVSSGGNQ